MRAWGNALGFHPLRGYKYPPRSPFLFPCLGHSPTSKPSYVLPPQSAMIRPGIPCVRGSLTSGSVRRTRDGWLHFTNRGVGASPLGPHCNLRVPYSPSARDLSYFERGAVMGVSQTSWPFHSPQSVSSHMTPSKHKDLVLPTYSSGSPEHGPGGCVCAPSFRLVQWLKGQ